VKPSAAAAASSKDDIPDVVSAGAASKGSRSAAGAADGATHGASAGKKVGAQIDGSTDAAQSGDGTTQGSSPADQSTARDSAQPTAASKPRETLSIPEATPAQIEAHDTSEPAAMEAFTPLAPLLGYWKQVDSQVNQADFAPGGYAISLLAIRPSQKSMQVYRAWGSPPLLVVAAELRATFDPAEKVRIEESPSQPSHFFTNAIDLPAHDAVAASRAVPATTLLPCDASWKIEHDGMLRLDGKLYQRIQRAEFQQITQPQVVASSGGANAAANSSSSASAVKSDEREPTGGVDFFGARVKGRYICFVCDISGSMMGDKLEALKRELERTIRAMPAGTHFAVVFFSDQTMILGKGWTKSGTRDADVLLKKVQGVGCMGGTDPNGALQYAFTQLDPIPHELFLLTDGQFGQNPMPLLMQLNGGADRTRIHTLAMGDDAATAPLEAIATTFGGTFTKVAATTMMPSVP